MSPRNRDRRQSAARRRAETHSTGFETTMIRIPEGLSFFEAEAGIRTIDIVPFTAGKGNPFAEPGELYYERTFWCWRRIGAEEKSYCCLHKTFGEKDPVQEWKTQEAKNPNADQKYLKDLSPKERQLFLVLDQKDQTKIQIWDVSHHLFGKLLDSRIKNSDERMGWDQFYFPDSDGMSLRLTFEEMSGGGYSWMDVTAIDFIPRDGAIPDKIANHGSCLDDLLVKTPYNDLRRIFLDVGGDEETSTPAARKEEKREESAQKKEESKREEPAQKKEAPPEKKEESPSAGELGLRAQDEVIYQKTLQTIAKIAPDGTLTLMDADDNLTKGVLPNAVKKVEASEAPAPAAKKEAPAAKKEAPAAKKEASGDGEEDDSWDF